VRHLVFVHTNLHLCDKVTDINYEENVLDWSENENDSDTDD